MPVTDPGRQRDAGQDELPGTPSIVRYQAASPSKVKGGFDNRQFVPGKSAHGIVFPWDDNLPSGFVRPPWAHNLDDLPPIPGDSDASGRQLPSVVLVPLGNGHYIDVGKKSGTDKPQVFTEATPRTDRPKRPRGAFKKGALTASEFIELYEAASDAFAEEDGRRPTVDDIGEALGVKSRTTVYARLRDAGLKWSAQGPVRI